MVGHAVVLSRKNIVAALQCPAPLTLSSQWIATIHLLYQRKYLYFPLRQYNLMVECLLGVQKTVLLIFFLTAYPVGKGRRHSKNTSEEESEAHSEEDNSEPDNSEPEVIMNSKHKRSTGRELDKKNTAKDVKADPDGPSTSTTNAFDDDDDDITEVKPDVNEESRTEKEMNGIRLGSRNLRSGVEFKDPTADDKEEEWYDKFLTEEDSANVELGSKIVLLLEILADAAALEEKVLVFSHSLISLDVIEMALGGGEIGGNTEDWCRGCDYFRMDGSTNAQMRKRWADIFNDEENKA